MDYAASIEAVLFVAGEEGVRAEELARILGISEEKAREYIQQLAERYRSMTSCAFDIIETAENYKLVTKKIFSDVIKQYAHSPAGGKLTKASLEVMAIIAYRQPITRMEIEEIRGVQSSGAIQKLTLHNLITEKGRLKTPGRPVLYGTTDVFLDYFGLKSLGDLPEITIEEDDSEKSLFFESFQQTFE